MAFIEPMHRNKPNITYLLTSSVGSYRVYKFTQKNNMRFGLWMLFDFAEQLYELIPSGGM